VLNIDNHAHVDVICIKKIILIMKIFIYFLQEFDDDDPLGSQKVILKKEENGVNIFENFFSPES